MPTPPVRDLSQWYSDITFQIPTEYKLSRVWMAQWIFFIKTRGNSQQFLPSDRYAKYTDLEHMKINKPEYVQVVDPKTPMGAGGTGEYFAADFKDFPVNQHLNNQLRARLDRLGVENELQVNEIDKYAKGQRQREKDRILYQREFRAIIDELNQTVGIPKLKDSQSPYNYIKSLSNDKESDVNENLVDYIRSQINDSQDMTMFMSNVYKGDIEKSFELSLKHYLMNMNKWSIEAIKFNNDFVKFNRACGLWYTDQTSGRGVVEYLHPCTLFTSPFSTQNGEDIVWWFYEKDITFADFVRKFGQTLTDEQLKEVFELNKVDGASHGMTWAKAGSAKGSQAKIRIGHMEVLTQDAEKFAEKYSSNRIPLWERKPLSWLQDKRTPNKYKANLKQKIYNVWYSCYYVPPPGSRLTRNSQTDWAWQSQYIFDIKKNIDMYRYGVDMRYAKSTLVIYKDERPSVYDIQEAFMPKMRTAWHEFQNCLINDVDGVGLSEDFLGAALKATDEANARTPNPAGQNTGPNQVDARLSSWKMLKQSGFAILKMTDKNGNPLPFDPSKFIIRVQNGLLDKAEKYLNIIVQLYQLMTTSLSESDVSEGQDPKPRTPVAGIQASLKASELGRWNVEKASREFLIMFGERCIQYILYIIKEHKAYNTDERWQELQNVIGIGNAMALESIEDYKAEDIGLTVSLEDVTAMKNLYVEITMQMLRDGKIDDADVELITSAIMQNYKYGAALLTIASKKIKREMAAKEQMMHQQKMEEIEAMQNLRAQEIQLKGAAKDQNIMTEGQIGAQLGQAENQFKHQSMMEQSEKRKNNKLEENSQKHAFEREDRREAVTE